MADENWLFCPFCRSRDDFDSMTTDAALMEEEDELRGCQFDKEWKSIEEAVDVKRSCVVYRS